MQNKDSNKIAMARRESKEEGKIEGKLEEKRQIALNMKNQGLDKEFIAQCLNISINELLNR